MQQVVTAQLYWLSSMVSSMYLLIFDAIPFAPPSARCTACCLKTVRCRAMRFSCSGNSK